MAFFKLFSSKTETKASCPHCHKHFTLKAKDSHEQHVTINGKNYRYVCMPCHKTSISEALKNGQVF